MDPASLRICLLVDAYVGSRSPLKEVDLPCDPRPFLPDASWERVVLEKATAVRRVTELTRRGFDLFFNLCDGAWDEDRPGIEVVETLERRGEAFTGAGSDFYEPGREAMKRVCRAWDIPTPGYAMVRRAEDLERALDTLRFPLIVKHPSSYGSIGLTPDSRVTSAPALRERARETMEAFGAALVEEFIEGREFTVLVSEDAQSGSEPATYTPVEFLFPEGETFKHFDLKWRGYHGMRARPVEDPGLAERLRGASRDLFAGLGGTGYGRCDLRVDAGGRAHMLEINPNCGVYYPASDPGSADLCLAHDPAGHEGFTRRVVEAALRRRRETPPWEVRPDGEGEHGLYATRTISRGDRIVAFEERAHVLVTRSHVEATWDERRRDWFRRYAWPLTEEVWVTWSADPGAWKPVNHACDPNAWLRGLDVVARREIVAGEEVTLDYATFCNELMPSFRCRCGAPGCRGTIRGTDHLEDFVERYGEHVSDYVRRKRQALGRGE